MAGSHPERTHRAGDCLLSYDVYLVTDQSPAEGGQAKPTPVSRQRFMTYVAPFDSPCRSVRGNGRHPQRRRWRSRADVLSQKVGQFAGQTGIAEARQISCRTG